VSSSHPVDLTSDDLRWVCCRCSEPLEVGPVELTYLGNSFWLDLPHCPKCGFYLVPESLALVRMAQAEQLLEDK
jgi:hypothetical protein